LKRGLGSDAYSYFNNHPHLSFSQLVNVDIIIDLASANENNTTVNIVVKNEELAFKKGNHALAKMEEIKQVIADNYEGELLINKN
jgi:hypothetical protein